jgi:hypothetical protein
VHPTRTKHNVKALPTAMRTRLAAASRSRYPAARSRQEYGYPVAKSTVSKLSRRTQAADTRLMHIRHDDRASSVTRVAAAALAALGAASAIPIPLAQLDFAGLINTFNIDSGDSPSALRIIAGVGGVLTIAVVLLTFTGAALALTGGRSARTILTAAALAGLVTAMPLWIPAGVLIGAAAILLPRPRTEQPTAERRSLLHVSGVHTYTQHGGNT